MGRSKGSRLKGWIENQNALRRRLDYYYAAPLPRQSREKIADTAKSGAMSKTPQPQHSYNGSVLHKHESKQRNPGLLGRVSLFCQGCVDGLITRGDITRLQNPPFRLLL